MSLGKNPTLQTPEVAEVAQRCLEAAVHSGDRAYEYMQLTKDTLVEVRVWPDGNVLLTKCGLDGKPLGEPLPELRQVQAPASG